MTATAPSRSDDDAAPAPLPWAAAAPEQRTARPSRWVRGRRTPAPSSRFTGFLRDLPRQAPLALAAALVVAALVALLSARAEPVHRATASAVVVPGAVGDTTDPDDATRVAAAYVTAASDPRVLSTATAGTGWSAREAADNVTVSLGNAPGVVDVTVASSAPDSSGTQVKEVAAAVLPALQDVVLAEHADALSVWTDRLTEQLETAQADLAAAAPGSAEATRLAADVELRLGQLGRIERAQPPALMDTGAAVALPNLPTSHPKREAATAFVVTAVLVAALASLLRGRRGTTLTRATGRRLARRGRGSYLEVPRDPVGTSVLLPLRGGVGRALAAGQQVVVLVAPGATRGEAASLVAPAGAGSAHLVVANLDQPWWRYVDATRVAEVVLVAPYGAASRGLAEEAVSGLAPLGAPVHLLLLTVPAGLTAFDVTTTGSIPAVQPAG